MTGSRTPATPRHPGASRRDFFLFALAAPAAIAAPPAPLKVALELAPIDWDFVIGEAGPELLESRWFGRGEIADVYRVAPADVAGVSAEEINQSPAFNPSVVNPGGHVPSKSCPSGADQSPDEKLEQFLRLARAM